MKLLKIIFLFAFIFSSADLFSFDFLSIFLHSEIAPKNSVFADVGLAALVLEDMEFNVLPLDARIEFMLPAGPPFSLGLFMKTPYPNFKCFGARIAYHFNLLDRLTDFYLAYSFDFGFLRNKILEENNDAPVPVRWYDFRFGARHFFNPRFGAGVESDFKFKRIIFLFTVKVF